MPTIEDIGTQLEQELRTLVETVAEGARGDIQKWAQQISNDTVMLLQEPDEEKRSKLRQSIVNQVRMIGEVNRIRATHQMWNFVERAVNMAIGVAFTALNVPPMPQAPAGD